VIPRTPVKKGGGREGREGEEGESIAARGCVMAVGGMDAPPDDISPGSYLFRLPGSHSQISSV